MILSFYFNTLHASQMMQHILVSRKIRPTIHFKNLMVLKDMYISKDIICKISVRYLEWLRDAEHVKKCSAVDPFDSAKFGGPSWISGGVREFPSELGIARTSDLTVWRHSTRPSSVLLRESPGLFSLVKGTLCVLAFEGLTNNFGLWKPVPVL
jgi:hypothetical protein